MFKLFTSHAQLPIEGGRPAARFRHLSPFFSSSGGAVPAARARKAGSEISPRPQPVRPVPRIEAVSHGQLTWVNIEQPTIVEIDWLRENYPFFHPLDLDDCLSKIQRPKIDEYDDYLFIVLHFPVYNKRARVSVASEVDFFIGENYLITLHSGDLRPLNQFFRECQSEEAQRAANMGHSSGFLLYQLIDRLEDYCFPILNKVGSNIASVEDRIFGDEIREVVKELSIIRRDVISLRRIVKPQLAIVASLEHKKKPFLLEELDVYWGNISDHVNKLWDILEDHREVVEGLVATSESMNSLRMNEIIKVLTLISTIMLPMAVISGIYGMNIDVLPFAHSEYSFAITITAMVITLVSMLTYFRVRRWI